MVLATTYRLSISNVRQQVETKQEYQLAKMARALLDEYVVTYPTMSKTGIYKNMWSWRISETPQEVLEPTDYDHYFSFVRITVEVTPQEGTGQPLSLSTVVARRGPDI